MTLKDLTFFLLELSNSRFTGKIIVNVHDGKFSREIKKEVTECVEVSKCKPAPAEYRPGSVSVNKN